MEDVIYGHKQAELILMHIVLNGHYHLVTLDIPNQKYMHYSSLMSLVYDADAIAMVSNSSIVLRLDSHFIYYLIMNICHVLLDFFQLCVDIDTGYNKFKDIPLEHVQNCPNRNQKALTI